jgi:hypothetical protein
MICKLLFQIMTWKLENTNAYKYLAFNKISIHAITARNFKHKKSKTLIAENIGGICIISPTNFSFTIWISVSLMCSQAFVSITYYKSMPQFSISLREFG